MDENEKSDSDSELLGGELEDDEEPQQQNQGSTRVVKFQTLAGEMQSNDEDDNANADDDERDEQLKRTLTPYSIWRPGVKRLMSTHSSGNDLDENQDFDEQEGKKVERQFTEMTEDQIGGRLEAYESVGVVAALLAGFAFGGLTAVDEPELRGSKPFIIIGFAATTSLTIALNLYALVAATWIFYWGRLLLGHGATMPSELYLSSESVRQYRSSAVIALMVSIPIFCLSMCFLCFVKLPETVAIIGSAFFLIVALVCLDMSRTLTKAFHVSKYMFEEQCSVEEAEEFVSEHDEWYFKWFDRIKAIFWNKYGLVLLIAIVAALIVSPYKFKIESKCDAD